MNNVPLPKPPSALPEHLRYRADNVANIERCEHCGEKSTRPHTANCATKFMECCGKPKSGNVHKRECPENEPRYLGPPCLFCREHPDYKHKAHCRMNSPKRLRRIKAILAKQNLDKNTKECCGNHINDPNHRKGCEFKHANAVQPKPKVRDIIITKDDVPTVDVDIMFERREQLKSAPRYAAHIGQGMKFKGICGCSTGNGKLKKRYNSSDKAIDGAKIIIATQNKDAMRAYPCPTESNIWHITSKTDAYQG